MTSDQFSEKPMPAGKKRCPYCGESMSADADACWLCLEAYPSTVRGRGSRKLTPSPQTDQIAWAIVGILAVLVICTLAFEAPGALILLVVLAVPATARTAWVVWQESKKSEGERPPWYYPLLFLKWLGISALAGFGLLLILFMINMVLMLALFVALFVICLAAIGGAQPRDPLQDLAGPGLACGACGSMLVVVLVITLVAIVLARRKESP
jgi:hypothetical protein